MRASSRIILNTLASYARLLVLALSGVLATPIALHVLGASDYGIFSVIGGSLAFLMFINLALTSGAQRHISFALGENSSDDVSRWLSASVIVHTGLALMITVVAIGCEHWVIFRLLTIPASRLIVAVWIYRMVVASMAFNIVCAPYQALLMAHESIAAISLLNILSSFITITGVFMLHTLRGDHLLWYGIICSAGQLFLFGSPAIYCLYRYPETRKVLRAPLDLNSISALLSFSGWNLFGTLSMVVRSQGPAVLLNIFFGPVANAAYGLAGQVGGFVGEISWGVLRATTPPIIKRKAAGDIEGMKQLAHYGNLFSLVVLWLVTCPVLFETNYCLTIWLHRTPPFTSGFIQLIIIALLIDQLTSGYTAVIQASGNIAVYSIVVSVMNCGAVFLGYFMMRLGFSPLSVLRACVVGSILAGCSRLWFARTNGGITVYEWLAKVFFPAALCVLGTSCAMLWINRTAPEGFFRVVISTIMSALVTTALCWWSGISRPHRIFFAAQLKRRFRSIVLFDT